MSYLVAFLSLFCMLGTIFSIVFGAKGSHAPTFIAIAGCVFYIVFLALARSNMDMGQQKTFSSLLYGFALFAVVAEGLYKEAKKQEKAEARAKIDEFRRNIANAKGES